MPIKMTICPLDCPDACSIEATVENGTVTNIKGDEEHPFTQGFLCRKVSTYHQRVHSPDRILFPQKRIGDKGEGKFERISWDEAWDILVNKLTSVKEQFGGEALLPYSYAGNMGHLNLKAGDPFFHKYGASQLLRTICSAAASTGWQTHYGPNPSSPPEKVKDADLIIAWGINIKVSNIHFMPWVLEARKRGARFVVIDPYENATAQVADQHIRIQPGGDTALALALLKILVEEEAVDWEFIQQHSEGYGELQDYLSTQSLSTLIAPTGLDEDIVRDLAQQLRDTPKTFIRIGVGLTRNTQGAMSVRAISCLSAALGLFDGKPGKGTLLFSSAFYAKPEVLSHPELMEKSTRTINMVQLGNALTELNPPIKALFVYSSNPVSVAPDASKIRRGLKREDLFTIVHEQFMTPTARYADLLLPATTCFENDDIYTGYGHFYLSITEAIIPPQGEAISNFDLFQTLARKMGYTDDVFQENVIDRRNRYLHSIKGLSPEQAQNIQPGQAILSQQFDNGGNFSALNGRKFRFSSPQSEPNQPAIPQLLPRKEFDNTDLQQTYPFGLITPPDRNMLNSTFGERHSGKLGKVLIHPNDAAIKHITDGATVKLFNQRGHTLRVAKITPKTQEKLLVAEGIYWESVDSDNTGINDLTSQTTTDLGGGGTFHESRVDIEVA